MATQGELIAEFDRQVQNLIHKGYPALAGLSPEAFVALLEPLKPRLEGLAAPTEGEDRVAFVLVVQPQTVPPDRTMPLTELKDKPGFIDFRPEGPEGLAAFGPLPELGVPAGPAYLVLDVDTGSQSRNVTPDDALVTLRSQGRTPLTVAEGIALLTHFPERLRKNHCFSLAGSRSGDRRVPALWISKGHPKLGWCWAGNPHTWLGTASCAARAGTEPGAGPSF